MNDHIVIGGQDAVALYRLAICTEGRTEEEQDALLRLARQLGPTSLANSSPVFTTPSSPFYYRTDPTPERTAFSASLTTGAPTPPSFL